MTVARFLLPAEEEMVAAAQYYEHQSVGLGTEFLTEVERTIAAISTYPNAAPKVKRDQVSAAQALSVRSAICSGRQRNCHRRHYASATKAWLLGGSHSFLSAQVESAGPAMGFTHVESGSLVRSSYYAANQI